MVCSVGSRLLEERKKLGLTQAEFAALAGKTSKSQERYEADERQPDAAYLSSIAKHGVDVLYLLTGQRTPGIELIRQVRRPYGEVIDLAEKAEQHEKLAEVLVDQGRSANRDDLERWASAIAAVEEGLSQTGRRLEPASKAELILAAYDLLEEDSSSARDRVIRLVAAA